MTIEQPPAITPEEYQPRELPKVRLRDRSYYEFSLGLRAHNETKVLPTVRRIYRQRTAAEGANGEDTRSSQEAVKVVEDTFAYQYSRWCRRNQQLMMWRALQDVESDVRDRIAEERAVLPAGPYGTLRLNPSFVMPEYYSSVGFHLMPGSYPGNNLVYIFQHYLQTRSLVAGNHKTIAERLAPAMPERPKRILDIGCGSGRSTFPLKQRYPDAEVHGIDVAPNLLVNAHLIAQYRRLHVHFSQQAGEQTDFPDGYFDAVVIYTLQHEMPLEPMQQLLNEAARVCAPGGRVINADIVPLRHMTPIDQGLREWEVDNFEEPYLGIAGRFDIPEMLRNAGLVNIREIPPDNFPNGLDFPWITYGERPA